MIKEQKDLLLKDLCARLPYGVKCSHKNEGIFSLTCIDLEYNYIYVKHGGFKIGEPGFKHIKPYLFPLSSMTEEQKNEYNRWKHYVPVCHYEYGDVVEEIELIESPESFEYLIENHFDYYGLIPMGLAIDATGLNIY